MTIHGVSLHDATLLGVIQTDHDLVLCVEGATLANGTMCNGRVRIQNVEEIYCGDERTPTLAMKSDDGEIFSGNATDGELILVVQWNEFQPRSTQLSRYRILGESIEWTTDAES